MGERLQVREVTDEERQAVKRLAHSRTARWAVRGTVQANSDVFHSQDVPQTPDLR